VLRVFKFAFGIAIVIEWLTGTVLAVEPVALAAMGARVFMFTLAGWMVLETLRTIWRVVMALPGHR
jgi:hypothetical protein